MRAVVLILVLAVAAAIVHTASAATRRYPRPMQCSGMEDYRNSANIPRILTPEESGHRFLYRPWHNTGLGHTLEVYNLVLKLALHNNLTFVHTPLSLGHGPFLIEPESYFQFGRHPTEVLPSAKSELIGRRFEVGGVLREQTFPVPETQYKSHQNEAELKFRAFVTSPEHRAPAKRWFEVPTPMVMADQDSDWGETGAWFRSKYESALSDRAYNQQIGIHNKVKITFFDRSAINVAVHIRRGDALSMGSGPHSDGFYIHTINHVLSTLREVETESGGTAHPPRIHIHIFSDGSKDQPGQMRYVNEKGGGADIIPQIDCDGCVYLHLGTDETDERAQRIKSSGVDAIQTFHHLTHADILIQSISMFSNTAAILARNIKVLSGWNRSKDSLPNTIASAPGHTLPDGTLSRAGFRHVPEQLAKFKRLWKAYRSCNSKRWLSAAVGTATASRPPPPPPPPPPSPPPAPPVPEPAVKPARSESSAAADAQYELHMSAHDEF